MSLPANTVNELFDRAFALHHEGRLDAAEAIYREVLNHEPEHAYTLHSLGLIAHARGQRSVALELLRRAIALNFKEAVFHHSLAQVLRADGHSQEALSALHDAVSINPEFVAAWQAIAQIHHSLNHSREAAKALLQVSELTNKTAESYNQAGVSLAKANRLDEACAAFKAGIACNPRGVGLYYNLGNALSALGKFSDAVTCLVQASMQAPRSADVFVALSNALCGKGDIDGARRAQKLALTLSPNLSESLFRVGTSLESHSATERGARETHSSRSIATSNLDFTARPRTDPHIDAKLDNGVLVKTGSGKVLEKDRRRANAEQSHSLERSVRDNAYQRAITHHSRGEFNEAEFSYRHTLTIDPQHFDALQLLGALMGQRGDPLAAIELIRQSLQLNARQPVAHSNLAGALLTLGRVDEALLSCDEALRLNALFVPALLNKGMALLKLSRFTVAMTYLDKVLKINPAHALAWSIRGTTLIELDRFEESLLSYERALKSIPDDPVTLSNCGTGLVALRLYRRAIDCLQRLIELDPQHDYAIGNQLSARLHCCDWDRYFENAGLIVDSVQKGHLAVRPLGLLAFCDDPEVQLKCARLATHSEHAASTTSVPAAVHVHVHDKRLRIAYVSADFGEHPVSNLIVGLLEKHNQQRFEVVGISLRPEENSILGQRVKAAFTQFRDVSGKTDTEVAALMRSLSIDIAVDLQGSTRGARANLFRAAVLHRFKSIISGFPAHLDLTIWITLSLIISWCPRSNAPSSPKKSCTYPNASKSMTIGERFQQIYPPETRRDFPI